MSTIDEMAFASLQQLLAQEAPPKDILQFIMKQWPKDAAQIIYQAASAYKLMRELMEKSGIDGFASAGDKSHNLQSFQFHALLGKAICGKLPE